ncbi:MAG: hypothetical protein ACK5KR_09095 [Breznakia sp.]
MRKILQLILEELRSINKKLDVNTPSQKSLFNKALNGDEEAMIEWFRNRYPNC